MNTAMKFALSAAWLCGFAALAPSPSSAMPVDRIGVDVAPVTEQAHAVRICNRWGRCWWTTAGHYHRRYFGYRYGWRYPHYRHYGYHWHGHRGYGWHGGWR